jgi:hypothetical protein
MSGAFVALKKCPPPPVGQQGFHSKTQPDEVGWNFRAGGLGANRHGNRGLRPSAAGHKTTGANHAQDDVEAPPPNSLEDNSHVVSMYNSSRHRQSSMRIKPRAWQTRYGANSGEAPH